MAGYCTRGETYRLWFTGYDGEKEDRKFLGYATSTDGLHWSVWPTNPLVYEHWVEDVNVVKQGDLYYMFAEGEHDNHSELLTSKDGIKWDWHGELEVARRMASNPRRNLVVRRRFGLRTALGICFTNGSIVVIGWPRRTIRYLVYGPTCRTSRC